VFGQLSDGLFADDTARDFASSFRLFELGLHLRVRVLCTQHLHLCLYFVFGYGDTFSFGDFSEHQAAFYTVSGQFVLAFTVFFFGDTFGVEVFLPGLATVDQALEYLL
jgi:hypothetical protein